MSPSGPPKDPGHTPSADARPPARTPAEAGAARSPQRPTPAWTAAILLFALAAWACSLYAFVARVYFGQAHLASVRLAAPRWAPLTDRLVVIVVDSVPFSMGFDPKNFPFLASLRPSSTYGMAWSAEPTMTSVMVETINTGNWPFMWTVVRDWRMQRIPHETWLDGVKRAGLALQAYGDIPWGEQVGDRMARFYTLAEENKEPSGRPIHWEDRLLEMDPRARDALNRAVDSESFDVLVWHIMGTDLVMHRFFRDSAGTRNVLRMADRWIREIKDRLDDGRTTFLLLSDHGCAANGRHGTSDPEARPTFYLFHGPGIVPGLRVDTAQVDLASTLLSLFGLTPNAPNAGRPIVEALDVPWSRRAEILLAAASQRIAYLKLKRNRGDRYTADPTRARAELDRARRLAASGRPRDAAETLTRLIRRLHRESLAARRQNQPLEPALWWVALGLALLSIIAAAGRSARDRATPQTAAQNRTGGRPDARFALGLGVCLAGSALWDRTVLWAPLAAVASIALLLSALGPSFPRFLKRSAGWVVAGSLAAYLILVTQLHLWTGRICNTLLFRHTENAEQVFVVVVDLAALLGLALLFALRKHIRPVLERAPFAVGGIACVAAAGFNGYYQGFYFPFVMGLFTMMLAKGVPEGFLGRSFFLRWAVPVLPLAACGGILLWQTTWNRHFYYLRYALDEMAWGGGLAAAGAFMLACLMIRWFVYRDGEALLRPRGCPRALWAASVYLAVVVGLRHLLWPVTPEHLCLSLGHHLLSALPAQLAFSALCLPALWPAMRRRELLLPLALAVASALTATAGSPFESPAVLLLFALLIPMAAHPVFSARHPVAVPAAAFALVAARVMAHVVFDFKFNYTTVHDLLGYPSDVTWTTFIRMLPTFAMRQIPVMAVLCILFCRRLDRVQILETGLLVGLFWACRALYIAVLMHLSRDQLYLNWRNTGEAIHYAFFFAAFLVCLPLLIVLKRKTEKETYPDTAPEYRTVER